MKTRVLTVVAPVILFTCASIRPAWAHASLDHSNIKTGQAFKIGHAPGMLRAFFAENLDPTKSWINVFSGVADHGLVNEKSRSKLNFQNPKELTLNLPALAVAKYYFIWYTHSAVDGHFAAGIVYFRVVK